MTPLITLVLEAKEALMLEDKNKENGWDHVEKKWNKKTRGYNKNKRVQLLLKKLSETPPPGYTYKLGFARLNSVEEVRGKRGNVSGLMG